MLQRCSQPDALLSSKTSWGVMDLTLYVVVSIVEPPASHTRNLVPGLIDPIKQCY